MTTQENKMNQLLSELLGSDAATLVPPATAASTTASPAASNEAEMLRSLFGLMQEPADSNLDGLLGTDLTVMDDSTLLTKLDQQFEDLCETFVALKTRPVAAAHPEGLEHLESHLAGAQAEIQGLMPDTWLEELAPEQASEKPDAAPKKNSKIRRLRSRAILFGGVALCLPLALKIGIPGLLSSRQMGTLLPAANKGMDQVVSVKGSTLTIQAPGQPPQPIQLAGIAPASEYWQAETTGVISTLIESTHGQVSVSPMGRSSSGESSALIELPNGTTLQQVLLEDGVAKLDSDSLSRFPADLSAKLQAAQALAQAQRKISGVTKENNEAT